ncbi:MAG: hypothetical protein FD149_2691 [Rhodospirillaceae bacterium]|nr:MAG: hypothetical protein FD149_2691 [Rhodospirillaceae bacterium]
MADRAAYTLSTVDIDAIAERLAVKMRADRPDHAGQWLSIDDLVERTRLSPRTIRARIVAGRFPRPIKLGINDSATSQQSTARWRLGDFLEWDRDPKGYQAPPSDGLT